MQKPAKPVDEEARINALKRSGLLDTAGENRFDRLTRLAKQLFSVEMTAISLIDNDRQWFKSSQGLDVCETHRDISFCGHAILNDDIFIINDAVKDARFSDNPLVTGEPFIRFYAGVPIKSLDGKKIGTLCIIDNKPRDYTASDLSGLVDIALLVETEIQNFLVSYAQQELTNNLDEEQRKALIDEQTRCWNEHGFQELFRHQWQFSIDTGLSFGVVLLRLDNDEALRQKYGNDSYQMLIGRVSEQLKTTLRDTDVAARTSDCTFAAIIDTPSTDLVIQLAHRIHRSCRMKPIVVDDGTAITISVTVAVMNRATIGTGCAETFLQRLTQGLDECHAKGGNQVITIDDVKDVALPFD